jgi:hypothetical protein
MTKMKYHKEWRDGSLINDLKRRYLLCQMIEVGRERRTLELKMAGYLMADTPEQWKTSVDQRCGSKYSFIICGAPWYRGRRRVFAIEHATGAIFAVYEGSHSSRVNRERRYGTLDTLEDWNWAYIEPKLRLR